MRRMRFHGVRMLGFGIIAICVAGLVTAGLWNVLVPSIFGLRAISFTEALGLMVLGRVLFGGWHMFGRPGRRGKFVGRWNHLSPEEKERFRSAMHRCGEAKTETRA